jgi:hypothetical protein
MKIKKRVKKEKAVVRNVLPSPVPYENSSCENLKWKVADCKHIIVPARQSFLRRVGFCIDAVKWIFSK